MAGSALPSNVSEGFPDSVLFWHILRERSPRVHREAVRPRPLRRAVGRRGALRDGDLRDELVQQDEVTVHASHRPAQRVARRPRFAQRPRRVPRPPQRGGEERPDAGGHPGRLPMVGGGTRCGTAERRRRPRGVSRGKASLASGELRLPPRGVGGVLLARQRGGLPSLPRRVQRVDQR
eukprot:gene11134-biopygen11536